MSDDMKQQTTSRFKASGHFALQMAESTEITNKAVLLMGTISLQRERDPHYYCRTFSAPWTCI